MKLTVKEYASRLKVSVQSVYQRIDKGTLKYIVENDKKYVIVDKEEIKPLEQEPENFGKMIGQQVVQLLQQVREKDIRIAKLEERIDQRDKEINKLHKDIKRLNKEVKESMRNEKETLMRVIGEIKQLQIEAPIISAHKDDEDIIEVKEKKKKKRKKK